MFKKMKNKSEMLRVESDNLRDKSDKMRTESDKLRAESDDRRDMSDAERVKSDNRRDGLEDTTLVKLRELTGQMNGTQNRSLLILPELAITLYSYTTNDEFKTHRHPQKEWIIVYSGSLEIIYDGIRKFLQPGDSAYIKPDISHQLIVKSNVQYIMITIPRST